MAFLSGFVSYIIVFAIFLAVAFAGIKIGITARKKKDAAAPAESAADNN